MDPIFIWLAILIFAALLGIIPGAIAQKKGESFVAWWLFGTFLFIFALIFALLLKPKGASRGQASKGCVYCGAALATSDLVCHGCHRGQPILATTTNESWQNTVAADDDVAKWAKQNQPTE